jgi:uncharacterized protein (TIGR03083 family)
MTTTTTDIASVAPIRHAEAMALAAGAYDRFLDLLRSLEPGDWTKPTDCARWDVRAIALHVLGAAEANASVREMVHQQRRGRSVGKEIGGSNLDGTNEVQVREGWCCNPMRS